MNPALGFIAASLAVTAVSTYIQHQEAAKKEKRLNALADRAEAARKAELDYSKQKADQQVSKKARILQAAAARRTAGAGFSPETSMFKIETQGRSSSLKGAKEDHQTQYNMGIETASIQSDYSRESARSPSLTSQLGIQALDIGASVLGVKAQYEAEQNQDGDWFKGIT